MCRLNTINYKQKIITFDTSGRCISYVLHIFNFYECNPMDFDAYLNFWFSSHQVEVQGFKSNHVHFIIHFESEILMRFPSLVKCKRSFEIGISNEIFYLIWMRARWWRVGNVLKEWNLFGIIWKISSLWIMENRREGRTVKNPTFNGI